MTEEVKKSAIEQLLEEWEKDAVIDKTEPGRALLQIPVLHHKYLKILIKYNLMAKDTENQLEEVRRVKLDYYSGRMSEDELKNLNLKPFKFVLKGEARDYVERDSDVLKAKARIIRYQEISRACESILKELNARTYQLRAFCDWEKFMAGQ